MGLLVLAVTLGTVLARTQAALRATTVSPGVAITSGCEEESMFALWRGVHGQPTWLDLSQPPYASAYFNWLFYRSYGAVAQHGGNPNDGPALIRSARWFTLAGATIGALVLGLLAWRLTTDCMPGLRWCAVALASGAFFGPLTGWWVVTIRPDIWAMTAECAGLVALLSCWRRLPVVAVIASAACFYTCWAFKHNYIQGLGISLLFLASHRQWKMAASLLSLLIIAWALTVYALGPNYLTALGAATRAGLYDIQQGLDIFVGAAIRCAPFIAPAAGLLFLRQQHPTGPLIQDTLRLALIGLPLSLVFTFAISCKIGSSTNYYFSPLLFLAMLGLIGIARITSFIPTLLGMLASLALACCVLATASRHMTDQTAMLAERWTLWQTTPSPRYAHDQRLNLPWLNPGAPVFLTAYNYADDRRAGLKFAHDGIGGLIQQGYFQSLLLPDEVADAYDGAALTGYERRASGAGVVLWVKRPSTGAASQPR